MERNVPSELAAYVRLSVKSDDSVSIASQRAGITALCQRNGWPEPAPARWYVDDGVSASTVGKRPAFEQLMKAITDGDVDSIICRDDDRFVRHPMELETVIPVLEARAVPVYFTHGSELNLTTPDGRLSARIRGAVARAEVEKKSQRQKSSNTQRAAQGQPYMPGRTPFGYRKVNGGLEIVPDQAEAIRWGVETILSGGTRATVMRRWNEQGFRTNNGAAWNLGAVRVALTNYTIAGKRKYQKTSILSDAPKSAPEILDGSWEPIVPWGKFQALLIVMEPDRSHSAGNKIRYLGSGIYKCGDCGDPGDTPVVRDSDGRTNLPVYRSGWRAWKTKAGEVRKSRTYLCQSCGRTISRANEVDAYVEAQTKEALRVRAIYSEMFGATEDQTDRGALEDELSSLDEKEGALADALLAGNIRRAVFESRTARLSARREEIQKALATETAEREAFVMFVDPDKAASRWEASSIEIKREMLGRLYRSIRLYPSRKADPIERLVEMDSYAVSLRLAPGGQVTGGRISDMPVSQAVQVDLFGHITGESI